MFFPASLLARTEETKPSATKEDIHTEHRNTTTRNKHKKTKARFVRLL